MKTLYQLTGLSVCLLLTCTYAPSMGQSALIKDICPGKCGSMPTNLTTIGTTLYFTATNGQSGQELFKSNGTSAGTVLIKDIRVGKLGSSPSQFTLSNGKVFFVADNGINGEELWKTDGTTAGTGLVKDIWAGASPSYISNLVSVNNVLYFTANDGAHGNELWKSDGTTTGTVLLKDFKPGLTDGGIQSMANFQDKLVFSRTFIYDYWVESSQMWRFDPITGKFSVLFRVVGAYMDDLTAHGGSLYYGLGDYYEYMFIHKMNPDQKGGTWFSSVAGYRLVWMRSIGGKLLVAGADEWFPLIVGVMEPTTGEYAAGLGDGVTDATVAGGLAYFAARDYRSDVNDGYSIFKTIPDTWNYPALATFKGRISDIEALGSQVIFSAYTSANGNELRFINANNTREGLLADSDRGTGLVALKMYPNPASQQFNLSFSALETGQVGVELYDMQGRPVQTLFEGEMVAGESRKQEVDASAIASGLYLVRMTNGTQRQYQKLTIAK